MGPRQRFRAARKRLLPHVFARAEGLCQLCGMPVVEVMAELRGILQEHGHSAYMHACQLIGWWSGRASQLWDIDHIQPLALGGDPIALANLRLVCLMCHRLLNERTMKPVRIRKSFEALDQERSAGKRPSNRGISLRRLEYLLDKGRESLAKVLSDRKNNITGVRNVFDVRKQIKNGRSPEGKKFKTQKS